MLQKGEFGYHQFYPLTGFVDPEPILYLFSLEMKVFYKHKCVRRISDSKMITLSCYSAELYGVKQEDGSWLDSDCICATVNLGA